MGASAVVNPEMAMASGFISMQEPACRWGLLAHGNVDVPGAT